MAPVSTQFNVTLAQGERANAFPLTQPFRHPIMLEAVEFAFSAPAATIASTRALLHQLNFGIKFGSAYAVLDKTAPLQSFIRRAGYYDKYTDNGNFAHGFGDLNLHPVTPMTARSWATWTLPAPVFVPEKAQIECLLEYDLNIPNRTDASVIPNIQVWCTLIGRGLPKMQPWPEVVRIPWITSHRTTPAAISVGPIDRHTPENALQNQNEEPVVVQRMLASACTQYVSDEMVDANVRISDTTGAYIVRERTPVMELFNGRTRAWDMGAVLKPKEFVVVEYDYDPTNMVGQSTPLQTYATSDEVGLIFGLVGYREMPTALVYPQVLVPATGQPPILPQPMPPLRPAGSTLSGLNRRRR